MRVGTAGEGGCALDLTRGTRPARQPDPGLSERFQPLLLELGFDTKDMGLKEKRKK